MTSIDYLVSCITELEYAYVTKQIDSETYGKYYREDIEQAKEMHKEEIIESYCNGCADITKDESIFPRETSEQYYQETFKTK